MKDIYGNKSSRREAVGGNYSTLLRAGPGQLAGSSVFLPSNPLQQAVFRGCVECIRVLVETPPYYSVDAPCGPDGLRPVHIAAREGHIHTLRYLVSAGACLQKCDGSGSSGLHHGAIGGQLRAVRWLLRHGAQIVLDNRGRSPIQVATDHDHMEIVSLLAKHTSCGSPNGLPPSLLLSSSSASTHSGHNHSNSSSPSTITTIVAHSHTSSNNKSPAYGGQETRPKKKKHQAPKGGSEVSPSEVKVSPPVQDSSSSGNSSLATTSGSNSPSLSPSATCSCSESSDKSDDYSTAPTAKLGDKGPRSPSPQSFYLHPPKSALAGRAHRRSSSQASFYLHPPPSPSGLLIESSKSSVTFAEDSDLYSSNSNMAPVTPVGATDFLPPQDGDEEKPQTPAPESPPPTPPKNGQAGPRKGPPPPPPPPPMPNPPPALPLKRPLSRQQQIPLAPAPDPDPEEENDYEDIDEIHDHVAQYEETNCGNSNRRLSRTLSAPPDRCSSSLLPPRGMGGLGAGKQRLPFIPPNFPDPPKDALIKPSEYLKSIQNLNGQQGKGGGGKFGKGGSVPPGPSPSRSSARVEEAIKMLNGNGMAPVPEETNAEDEFEEINPERINSPVGPGQRSAGGQPNEGLASCNGGGIKAEELKKVNLRKTPMSRTMSAPPLGRVLPDAYHENPDDIRKVNELNNLCNNGLLSPTPNNMSTISSAVIAELAESSQVGGVREWKEELRRRQAEQDKTAAKEMASYYSPINFVSEVPCKDATGVEIPPWKRQMMAKKAAEKARKEAEEQMKVEAEAKRVASIPPWRRQLLQRRDSDGKYAQ